MNEVRQTNIYIGLNDSETHQQIHETAKYIDILKIVCQNYHVAFSATMVSGGYFHDDGTYVDENTLVLTLLDADKQIIQEIAQDLCAFFHQESVMVTSSLSEMYFVRETI
ncbi:MAG: DUF3574 domain-containing protein [Erysipelotrichaceae bacterium]|nr:DUF3574 domain-containing protein [Erysipelotrichaceae bacterium]MBR5048230.1 DUF3574 domain-containing protein [Erysipelotrichaceae bacterium]